MKVMDGMEAIGEHAEATDGTVVRLFRGHARRLGRLLARRLRNPDDAADASQEVFLRLWRHEQAGDLREDAAAYMHTAAQSVAVDHERRRKSRGEDHAIPLDPDVHEHVAAGTDETTHWREGVAALLEGLRELPAVTQQVFVLHHFEGLAYPAVATRLGVSERSVERHMARALTHCKHRLRDYL